ncbi:guanylate kinase [Bifidobacterium xylocopae]|uniref:Guanylate kinase n=1 Tax=Bifidobacterium xylocopae TaxID=2493119 RepID=A0A366KDY0_9BIFI|nr:guanylate kinase [Bifidobacterium xylocopae]RBP99926.1 guanylate kinase [Bifidobacterium xylocopae]
MSRSQTVDTQDVTGEDADAAQRQACRDLAGKGRLVVLTGPTAVGKGTVEARLRSEHPEVWVSVSATTRKPRPGERDGMTYWFMDEDEFAARKARGEFLETALVHGMSHYGTPLKPVLDHMAQGVPTILEIDLQGAHRVRQRASDMGLEVVYVFLAPPSFDDLIKRLDERGTEDEDQRRRRLATARVEMDSQGEFDVVIVNDTVERAADALWRVIAREYGLG